MSPNRDVVFGVVTNLQEFVMVAAYWDPSRGKIKFGKSSLICEDVAQRLAAFVCAPQEVLGMRDPFPTDVIVPQSFLDRGSTGIVFKANFPTLDANLEYAVKMSRYGVTLQVERLG